MSAEPNLSIPADRGVTGDGYIDRSFDEHNTQELLTHVADDAKLFYYRGWMVGTAGNLSVRNDDGSFWITGSGKAKGSLKPQDFIRLSAKTEVVEKGSENVRPSAEASIHAVLYEVFPEARAVYHVHTIESNLVTQLFDGEWVRLPALEMLKGLNVWDDNPQVNIAVVPNFKEVPRVAQEVRRRFTSQKPQVPGFLIRNHGITVWAPTTGGALSYLELFDYLFRYSVAAKSAGL